MSVDVVDAAEEAQAAVAGVAPRLVEVEQGSGDLGATVGMDRAVALVQAAAQRHQCRIPAEIVDPQARAHGAGDGRLGQIGDQPVDARPAIAFLVGKEAGTGVPGKVPRQLVARLCWQLFARHEEVERLGPHKGIGPVEAGRIEQRGLPDGYRGGHWNVSADLAVHSSARSVDRRRTGPVSFRLARNLHPRTGLLPARGCGYT